MAYKIAFYDTKPYDEHSFTEANEKFGFDIRYYNCLLYTSPSPRDTERSRMPSSA